MGGVFVSVGCVGKITISCTLLCVLLTHYVIFQAQTAKSHATFSRAFLTQWPFLSALAMRPIDSPTSPSVCTKRALFFFWRRRLFYLVISLQVKETAEVGRLFFWTWDFVVNNYCCVRVPPLYGHWSIATWANSKCLIFQIEHRHKLFWQIGFKSTLLASPIIYMYIWCRW
jgi:hypothetical protein